MAEEYIQRLISFLETEMRMQAVYQPVMIRTLLNLGGKASRSLVAQDIMVEDNGRRGDINAYEGIVKDLPGRVLENRGWVSFNEISDEYSLNLQLNEINDEQLETLIDICNQRINDYKSANADNQITMNTWIFQANPDRFDVDTYVDRQRQILWSVNQKHFRNQINIGDKVYIWRAQGKTFRNSIYGIIAEGIISGYPEELSDDASDLWRGGSALPESIALRVPVTVLRKFLDNDQVIRSDQLARHPMTSELNILRMRSLTNYLITESEAESINQLIMGTGNSLMNQNRLPSTEFSNAPNDDPEEIQNTARRIRRGQGAFRANLLRAYGSRCVITGEGPEEVLEAVHVLPHFESGNNELDNGLLMRADLHHLFDDGLLSIDPTTKTVALDNTLANTSYWQFNGTQLRPRIDGTQISDRFLRERIT